jgi:hypothetical protein
VDTEAIYYRRELQSLDQDIKATQARLEKTFKNCEALKREKDMCVSRSHYILEMNERSRTSGERQTKLIP